MQTIGFKDFTIKQLFNVLKGGKVCLERKLQMDMTGNSSSYQLVQLEKDIKLFDKANEILPLINNRAFYISTISYIIRNKKEFSFSTLEFIVERLNKDLPINLVGDVSKAIAEEELNKLRDSLEDICKSSRNLLDFYFLTVLFNLQLVECCTFMELNEVNINFMNEMEKGIYEDRKLAHILNLYRNYYKKKSSDKKSPFPSVFDEINLTYDIENKLQNLKRGVLNDLSFEGKPFLQDKTVNESEHLSKYIKALTNHSQMIFDTMIKLMKVKLERTNDTQSDELLQNKDTVQLFLNCFTLLNNRIKVNLEKKAQIEVERKEKNPKYKSKTTTSFKSLSSDVKELTTENNQQITEYVSKIYNLTKDILKAPEETNKKPKPPKGTRDYTPLQMTIKNKAIDMIKAVFKKHGAVEIDTPVFELKDTLLGKYGEEGGKLIYDLEDQGGELLSLRYDLTVPFARYMGSSNLRKMKRFHISKVYRRDQPNMNKGRFREFYQCDFDIAGNSSGMLADSEVLKIMHEILTSFELDFEIKISHRVLLEAMIECSGCELNKFKTICSSVDKLDKEKWETVEKELINEKGLTQDQCDKLKVFVLNRGPTLATINKLEKEGLFGDNEKAKKALAEMRQLTDYLDVLNINNRVVFDLSLARGLDYYTGLIYEATLIGSSGLGSIGGGGRYDGLIGMFSNHQIPSVGMSIGIERLFIILEKMFKEQARSVETEVIVASIGKGLAKERMKLLAALWDNDIKAEALYEENPKPDKQLKQALENTVPFIIWIGEDEIKNGKVKLKCCYTKTEEDVNRGELIDVLKEKRKEYYSDLEKGLVVFKK